MGVTSAARQPLDGIRVIDLTRILSGPFCTMLLGDMGADVIKVERPGAGDDTRSWGPPFLKDGQGQATREAGYYLSVNRGKRSITLDITTPDGQEVIRRLVRTSDILVENFAPGVMERLGLGYEALSQVNPRLVYGAGSGYGRSGPKKDFPAMDLTVQAMAGIMHVTGFPDRSPVKAGPAVGDFMGGDHLYGGIMTALY